MSQPRSKTAFADAPRGTVFYLDPRPPSEGGQVIYIGVDTPHKSREEHILWSVTARNEKPDVALAHDIDENGVHTPATIRKNGPYAELVFGRRRRQALRLANTWRVERGDEPRRLPAVKFQGTDAELLELMLSENAHREDEDPIERARQAMHLLKFRTKAQVARAANVSVQMLAHWERVLDASPKVLAAVRARSLAWNAAAELVDLPFEEQEQKLDHAMEQQRVNGVRPTQREIARSVNPDRVLKPTVKQIRLAMEALKSGDLEDAGAEAFLRWVLGEVQSNRIKGLTKVLG